MKRAVLTALFLLSITTHLKAQDITFGIKGGASFIKIGELFHNVSDGEIGVIPDHDFYYESNIEMGTNFGAYFRVNLYQFYIQPEVNIVSLKSYYELGKKNSKWTQSSIDIPLLFGYNVYHPVAVYAGPIFSMISDRQLEGNEDKPAHPWTFEKSIVSIGVGINAVVARRFYLDFRYSYGITKVEHIEIDMNRGHYGTNRGALVEYNPSQFMVNLQIDLFSFGGEKKSRSSKSDWRNHKNLY